MDNITFFNRLTLALLERFYSAFPTPIDIDVKAIAMTIIPEDAEKDDAWNSLQAAEDAVDFLTEEGFLKHKGTCHEGGTFLQARLTLKGLAILGSTPVALEGKQPLIERIRKALSVGAKEAGTETVRLLTEQTFAAAVAVTPAVITTITR
jgi:hypothetical protein